VKIANSNQEKRFTQVNSAPGTGFLTPSTFEPHQSV
jgi:hypothetical protein